jgi:hypothetical protein
MSSANLDLVRSIYADLERGDFGHAEWAHDEIEYVQPDGPHPGTWIGHMPEGARDWASAWEDLRVEVEEYRELDVELVLTRHSGRGKRKVTRYVTYFDRDRALADLGLTPWATRRD